jgi:hypothetical protein
MEGEFIVKPFCCTYISRYSVYDVGGYRTEVQLDLQEDTGIGYFRRFGYDSFDDSSSDYDDRTALAVDYCSGNCVLVIVDRLAKIE